MPKAQKPRTKVSIPAPYARGVHDVIDDAIEYRHQNPIVSFKKIAALFPPLCEETLRNRYNGRGSKAACGGHNKRLTDEEERGVTSY
jgi:hypothetical protein